MYDKFCFDFNETQSMTPIKNYLEENIDQKYYEIRGF